ncbi:hypothetical protein HYPSUDRAFT_38907 [Hypholoma sublateritium FD-334 SS-4]|uniref:GST N-terminal domain-containing protein n=1 Tax=Hypholoma sublateritium (strain FD-334 SS-4) TaxID=945553 RepID=A0A0D2P6Z0_HYPSF|nr:hypothetical protein HYPSUDRAFT_38907 [Hypholoma sublateritium FD-334 SS-4]
MTIILYDVCSNTRGVAWSPSTWKIRYCLNLKGLDYKTEWVEFPDLEPLYKKLELEPTVKNSDGSPRASIPLIYDPSTKIYLTDSVVIAEYLDKTYPGPSIFPSNTIAIQSLLETAYIVHIRPIIPLVMPAACDKMNPRSADYYRVKRVEALLKVFQVGDTLPREVYWTQYRDGLGEVDKWYSKIDGPFLMGNTVSWGDFVVGSCIIWLRVIWGEESQEWKDITSWHGGRWANLINALQKYEKIM